MKNPPHPGLLVKDELDALGLSIAEAAAGLGVTRQQLHRVISGRSGVSPEMALRLEQGIGSTARLWLALQSTFDLAHLQQRPDAPHIAKLPIRSPA
ncbi:HigA family addiction module antitoxin [Acidisphaera sp. L21]|jgi:addiction module HigA family antidote|uniref:HigA family addiction module antitoxin n=1 Tax=Acidisphaera sp. L21 TaxID=1641851 RepID=UPI00131D2FE0|nr:HigA family addiction module antitoxin [Acidisphaera sp. L21]